MAGLNPWSGPDGVVWRVVSLGEGDKYRPLLSDDEAREAEGLRGGPVRDRYVVARGLRRELLAECLGRNSGALNFSNSEEGKPLLEDAPGWDFNISHSGDYVVVAARQGKVGVDLEQIREVREMERLVERYFHKDEAAVWRNLAESRKLEGFFLLWTAREAAMKCVGLGLARGLSCTRVSPEILMGRRATATVGEIQICLQTAQAPSGYALMLAVCRNA